MPRVLAIGCLTLLASTASAEPPATSQVAQTGSVEMTLSQIAAHNSQLAPSDPTFIKCVRSERAGSWVKRNVCRTNEDWDKRATAATQEARDIVDSIQTRGSSYPQEPPGSLVPLGPN